MTTSMHDLRGAVRAASKRMLRHARSRVAGDDWGGELRRRVRVMLDANDALVSAERAKAERDVRLGKYDWPEPLPADVVAALDEVFAMAEARK